MPQYYTYKLINSLDQQPFYVGKGSGSRMYQHLREAERSGTAKRSVHYKILSIIQAGGHIIYEKTDWETEQQAFDEEKRLIALLGRKDIGTGCLCNLTEGGEGVKTSPELNERRAAKHRGMKRSDSARANMKKAQIDSVTRRKQENGGSAITKETRENMSKRRRGIPWSENARAVKREKPTAIPVQAFKKDTGEFVGEWESMALCAKELNCDLAAVWKILSGFMSKAPDGSMRPYKSHKGYTFKYK